MSSYSKIPDNGQNDDVSSLPPQQYHLLSRTPSRRATIAGCLLAAFLLLTYACSGDELVSSTAVTSQSEPEIAPATPPPPKFFNVVIPGGRKNDLEVCRTILSAQVLNYPIPQLIPFPEDEVDEASLDQPTNSTARLWLESNLEWLSRTPPEGEDGLVLLLDGPGVYFQLRPSVLLSNYYRILREADERAQNEVGHRSQKKEPIHHSVIFPASDTCSLAGTDEEGEADCLAIPDFSTRFLGGGYMLGPASDIRRVLTRALAKLTTDQPSSSTTHLHNIFTVLFAEQHRHRHAKSSAFAVFSSSSTGDAEKELGIALDYSSLLGATVDPESIDGKAKGEWKSLPASSLPKSISTSPPPFWTVFADEADLPKQATWADVPLFYPQVGPNLDLVEGGGGGKVGKGHDTTTLPSALLLPPSPPPTKPLDLAKTWSSLWFHPHARTLYTAAQHLPATIVASINISPSHAAFSSQENQQQTQQQQYLHETTFWNPRAKPDTAGAWTVKQTEDGAEFWPWRDMCDGKEVSEGVFGDGRGKWVGRGTFF